MPKINFVALDLLDEHLDELTIISEDMQKMIKDYEFIPMHHDCFHMTLVFLGSILEIKNERKRDDILFEIDTYQELFDDMFKNMVLEFDRYAMFPDSKKNLIVAKFKCRNKNFLPNMLKFKKMFCPMGAKEENFFTPHITMGKVKSLKDPADIEKLLKKFSPITQDIEIIGCHLV